MRFTIVLTAMFVAQGYALAQSTIKLHAGAVVEPSSPITLGAIASVDGEDAAKLRDVVLVQESDRADGRTRIDLDAISVTLKQAGFKLGRITFSGSQCVIDPHAPRVAENTEKNAGKSISGLASELRTSDVRGAICAKLTELYGVSADSIRLTFRGSDDALLTTSVDGMQVTIQPAAGGKSVPVQVRVFRGDEVIASGTVRVGVEIQRSVLVSVSPIDRAEPISAANTIIDSRWLTPDTKPAPTDEAYGSVALSRIESGAVVESRSVKAPNVVTKGEIIRIDCLSGGIALQAQARALEHGKQGQVIQFQSLNSKKIFRARVSGAGSAVAEISSR